MMRSCRRSAPLIACAAAGLLVAMLGACGGGTPDRSGAVQQFMAHQYAQEYRLAPTANSARTVEVVTALCSRQQGTVYRCYLLLRSGRYLTCRVDYRPEDKGYVGVACKQGGPG